MDTNYETACTDKEFIKWLTEFDTGWECEYSGTIVGMYEAWLAGKGANDQWISVNERLPNERCLAYTDNDDLQLKYRIIPKGLFRQVASDATHWQPLPDKPKE